MKKILICLLVLIFILPTFQLQASNVQISRRRVCSRSPIVNVYHRFQVYDEEVFTEDGDINWGLFETYTTVFFNQDQLKAMIYHLLSQQFDYVYFENDRWILYQRLPGRYAWAFTEEGVPELRYIPRIIPGQWGDTINQSELIIPNRRITDEELDEWIQEYRNLGYMNAYELEIIRLINEIRIEMGGTPYHLHLGLSMASRFHGQDLSNNGRRLGHYSPYHGSPEYRVRMFSIPRLGMVGENGHGRIISSPIVPVNGWMRSLDHRVHMLQGIEGYWNTGRPYVFFIGVGTAGLQHNILTFMKTLRESNFNR